MPLIFEIIHICKSVRFFQSPFGKCRIPKSVIFFPYLNYKYITLAYLFYESMRRQPKDHRRRSHLNKESGTQPMTILRRKPTNSFLLHVKYFCRLGQEENNPFLFVHFIARINYNNKNGKN